MKAGNLGEIAVAKEFAKCGFEIYSPIGDNASHDLLVSKGDKIYCVEVKSTASKSGAGYAVQVKKVRANRTKNRIINFDNDKTDILAVYIIPKDQVIFFKAKDVEVKSALTVYGDGRDGRAVDCANLES